MRQLRALAISVFILAITACAESPEERYLGAIEAGKVAERGKAKKERDSLLENYLLFFTKASAELLRSADQVATRVSQLTYLQDVRTLLPKAKAEKVEIVGNLAILFMTNDGGKFTVYMVQEKGNWVIDVFSMKQFWAPIATSEGG